MPRQRFTYGDNRIEYEVFFSPARRDKITIHVHPDASVQVDVEKRASEAETFARCLAHAGGQRAIGVRSGTGRTV